ncbi:hypothetical protein [Niabella aurantiaca]|uniref:hypothetical protein n=1 Tax=Niabella aurantiaca TaxID=379900 RepID=UPI000373C21A|nr:hypothetical protein [Niabella aurantiaca]
MKYTIYRGATKIIENLKVTGAAKTTVMQNDYVEVSFRLTAPVEFKPGDKITVFGKDYFLNIPGEYEKQSSRDHVYKLIFEAKWYDLNRVLFKFPDSFDNLTVTESSVTIDAAGVLALIVSNMTAAGYTGYTVGQCDATDEKQFDFSNQNCMEALVKLFDTYKLEFWISGTTINFGLRTLATAYTMKYGRGNGLYSLSRKNKFTANPFNKLYVKGGTRNIPPDYGSDRLRLPSGTFIKDDALITEYGGVIEQEKTFDDIFPKRYGTVTAIDAGNRLVFNDSSIDFDINDHILGTPEQPVKPVIHFETGLLAGYDLSLVSYDHATKTITLEVNTSEKLAEKPGATFYPQVGDKYGIYDILMPQTYIDNAELELLTEGQNYFDENKALEKRYLYGLEVDPLHIRRNYIEPTTEKNIRVIDEALGIDEVLRVNSVSRPISNADSPVDIYKINCELSSVVSASYQSLTQLEEKENEIYKNGVTARLNINTRTARQYYADFNDLLKTLFDPTGGDLQNILALAAKFGTDNQNLDFDGVTFSPNFENDENKINISAGSLIHYIYKVDETHYTWTMSATTVSGLDPTKLYYVYAKISKTSVVDTDWIISENKMLYDAVTGYYIIHIGTLMKVVDGKRRYYFVKGVTTILGDTITTGKIQSADGTSFVIDLDNNTLTIGGGSGGGMITVYTATPTAYKVQDRWIPAADTTISEVVFKAGKTYVTQFTRSSFTAADWKMDTMVYVQSTQPQNSTTFVGAIWIDTSIGNITKTYNGSTWTITDASGATVFTTLPSGYKTGDLYIPSANQTINGRTFYANKVYRATTNAGTVDTDFAEIDYTGATIFTSLPSGWKVGDLYIPSTQVTINGKTFYIGKVYRATSASGTVDTAFVEVDYKPGAQIYTTQPTSYVKGDIWDVASSTVISGIQFTAGDRYISQMTATSFSATHWKNEKMIYVQGTAPQTKTALTNALWVDTSKGNIQKFFDGSNWIEKGSPDSKVYSQSPVAYEIGSLFIPNTTTAIGSTIFYVDKAYRAASKTGDIPADFLEVTSGDYYRSAPSGWSTDDLFRPTTTTVIGGITFSSDKVYQATGNTGSVSADFLEVPAANVFWTNPMPYKAGDMIIPSSNFTIGSKTFYSGKIYRASGNTGDVVTDFGEVNYGASTSYVGNTAPSGSDFKLYDTWLETNASGGKLWYWNGSAWTEGVVGSDPSGAVADYLNDALLDISTEITKGLVLSGVIGAKNSSGTVTAYMNGSDYTIGSSPSQICFAAGVSNFGLTTETQKVAILRDGSGWLAGGNISWNTAGDLTVDATVYATSGEIGSLSINNDGLFADGVSINATGISYGVISEVSGWFYSKGFNLGKETSSYKSDFNENKTLLSLNAEKHSLDSSGKYDSGDIALRVLNGFIYMDNVKNSSGTSAKGRVKWKSDGTNKVLYIDDSTF